MRIGILISGLILFISCSKDNVNEDEKKSAAQLLTQQQWIISKAGFDDNNNGLVDAGEDILADCQRDDIYVFNSTGSGALKDNTIKCDPPTNPDFTWKFLNQNKELQISFQRYFIVKLNENELVISPDLPLDGTFLLSYKH